MTGRRRALEGLLLLGALLITAIFATRAVHVGQRLYVPGDEPIRPWMNIPYVAHAYRVPREPLYAAVGLPASPPDKRPIREIARAQGVPVNRVIAALQTAISEVRAPRPAEPPRPPAAPTAVPPVSGSKAP